MAHRWLMVSYLAPMWLPLAAGALPPFVWDRRHLRPR